MSRVKNIAINTSSLVFASLLTRILSIPINAWLVRVLEPEAFGRYSYLLSFSLLFSPFVVLGLPALMCRETAQNPEKISLSLTSSYILMGVSSAIILPLILVTGGQNWLLFIAAMGMILSSSSTLLQLAIVGLNRSYLTAIAQVVISVAMSLGTLILIFIQPRLEWLICLSTLSALFQHILYYIIAKRYCPELVFMKRWPTWLEHWDLLSKSMPFLFLGVFSTIYFRIDMTLLEHWSTLSEVAGYSSAYKFVEISLVFITIVSQVFLAEFSSMLTRKDENVEKVFRKAFYLMLLISLPAATLMYFYAKEILYVFYGNKYLQESYTLQALSLTIIFLSARMLPSIFFQANNQVKIPSIIFAVSSVLNIVLNYFLIRNFGGFGAGIATLICEMFNLACFSYALKKYRNIQIFNSGFASILSAFFCMTGTLFAAQKLSPFVGVALGIFSFIGGFYFAGGLKSAEFDFLLGLSTQIRDSLFLPASNR